MMTSLFGSLQYTNWLSIIIKIEKEDLTSWNIMLFILMQIDGFVSILFILMPRHLFVIQYMNWYQQPWSSNLIGWQLEVGVVS